MTCRHAAGDPSCSSSASYRDYYSTPEPKLPKTPDAEKFEVLDAKEIFGSFLVLKVKYPNCSNCSYEGTKIMVFEGTNPIAALKWKRIDPHFRDTPKVAKSNEAPPPIARFPASPNGFTEAVAYAEWRVKRKEDERMGR